MMGGDCTNGGLERVDRAPPRHRLEWQDRAEVRRQWAFGVEQGHPGSDMADQRLRWITPSLEPAIGLAKVVQGNVSREPLRPHTGPPVHRCEVFEAPDDQWHR